MAITEGHLTLDEFLELPEEEPALEYVDGRIVQKVMPKGQHAALQYEIAEFLNRVGRAKKIFRAFPELRATFGGQSLVPDVSAYRWDRIPRNERGEVANDFWEPPDVAVEIVSPQQSVNGLIRRCLRFLDDGALAALLIDPADKSVLLFRAGREMGVLHGADRIDLGDILPGFQITVQELFDCLLL